MYQNKWILTLVFNEIYSKYKCRHRTEPDKCCGQIYVKLLFETYNPKLWPFEYNGSKGTDQDCGDIGMS